MTDEDEYLAALSISSLASDDDRSIHDKEDDLPSMPSVPSVDPRFRQRKFQKAISGLRGGKEEGDQSFDVESFGGDFPRRESYKLDAGHPTYATLEQGGKIAGLDFSIERNLKVQEVVVLSVYCVPHYVMDDDFMACAKKRRQRGNDFLGLQFELIMNDSSPDADENHSSGNSIGLSRGGGSRKGESPEHGKQPTFKLKSHLFNGTYTLVLSTSHGSLKAGDYTLLVSIQPEYDEQGNEKNSFLFHQDIRVMFDVIQEVKAKALAVNSSVEVSVGCKECVYYRVVLADKSQTISFSAKAKEGDVDMFVTNQFDGLVPVTQENAIWQSNDPGHSYLQILPDDNNLLDVDNSSGNGVETFLIGLFGQGDGLNTCVFSITASAPKPISRFVLASEYEEGEEAGLYIQGNSRSGPSNSVSSSMLSQSVTDIAKGKSDSEPFVLPLNEYHYFSVQFNPVERGRVAVVMDLNSLATTGGHLKLHERYMTMDTLVTEQNINTATGTAVYGGVEHLRHFTGSRQESDVGSTHSTPGKLSTPTAKSPSTTMPSSSSQDRDQYMVVLYISATVAYPSHENYTWKVSGHDRAVFLLDTAEWRYLSNTCYFSAVAFKYKPVNLRRWRPSDSELDAVDEAVIAALQQSRESSSSSSDLNASIVSNAETISTSASKLTNHAKARREFMAECSVWLEEEEKVLLASEMFQQRFKIFDDLYRAIDGFRLSYKDRRELLAGNLETDLSKEEVDDLEDHTLTYGETEFHGFRDFLQAVGAVDGQIFYDLGSGVGKAMIAAALSGICFVKVIGIEILPSLIQCSRDVIEELTSQVRTTQNTSLNQSSSHNFNTSGTGLIVRPGSNIHPEMAPGQAAALANMFPPLSPVRKGHHHHHFAGGFEGTNSNAVREANREFIAVGGGATNANNTSGFSGGSHAGLMMMDDLSVVSSSTYSYQVNAIPDLKEKLKRAKITLPMIETRYESCSSCWMLPSIVC